MTFLTSGLVDLDFGFFEHFIPLSRASDNMHFVHSRAFGSLVFGEIIRILACTVRDASVDSFLALFVSIMVERNTNQHVRWNIFVKPISSFVSKLGPISIVSLENFKAWGSSLIATLCKPHELVVSATDVLGCLYEMDQIFSTFVCNCFFDVRIPRV